jgi:hypothetical protein
LTGTASELHSLPNKHGVTAIAIVPNSDWVYLATPLAVWRVSAKTLTATGARLIAGHATEKGDSDGVGSAARFQEIAMLCVDADNEHLLIADIRSYELKWLHMRSGTVTTIAGNTTKLSAVSQTDGKGGALIVPLKP